MCYFESITFNDSDGSFSEHFQSIEKIVRKIELPLTKLSESKANGGKEYLDTNRVNKQFQELLGEVNWYQQKEFSLGQSLEKFDFYKNKIRLEVQFGADVAASENVHNSDLYFRKGKLDALILIVRCHDVPADSRVVSYKWIRNRIEQHQKVERIKIPIWLIGLYEANKSWLMKK